MRNFERWSGWVGVLLVVAAAVSVALEKRPWTPVRIVAMPAILLLAYVFYRRIPLGRNTSRR